MAYVFQEFPQVRYRSVKRGTSIDLETCVVHSREERDRLPGDWADSPGAAVAARERLEDLVSTAAAERAAADVKLSKKAQREMAKREAATGHHVPE